MSQTGPPKQLHLQPDLGRARCVRQVHRAARRLLEVHRATGVQVDLAPIALQTAGGHVAGVRDL